MEAVLGAMQIKTKDIFLPKKSIYQKREQILFLILTDTLNSTTFAETYFEIVKKNYKKLRNS